MSTDELKPTEPDYPIVRARRIEPIEIRDQRAIDRETLRLELAAKHLQGRDHR